MNKRVFGFLALSLLGVASAGAQKASAEIPNAWVQGFVNGGSAWAKACNTSYSVPIRCRAHVRGYFPNRTFIYGWADMELAPGACDYAYVYSTFYGFSFAQAAAECTFATPPPIIYPPVIIPGPGPGPEPRPLPEPHPMPAPGPDPLFPF